MDHDRDAPPPGGPVAGAMALARTFGRRLSVVRSRDADRDLVERSGLFDAAWYLDGHGFTPNGDTLGFPLPVAKMSVEEARRLLPSGGK